MTAPSPTVVEVLRRCYLDEIAVEHVARALADAGVLGPEQVADLRAEVERLRARIHEAVDECQRRYAPYVSRCDRHDGIARWFRQSLVNQGMSERDWTWNSQAMRTLAVAVVEERDALRAKVERVEALHHRYGSDLQNGFCSHCRASWPCPTFRALRGQS